MDPPPRRPLRDAISAIHAEAAGALGILGEAVCVAAKSWRVSLPAVLLILLPSSLLSLGQHFLFDPSFPPPTAQPLNARIPRRPAPIELRSFAPPTIEANLLVCIDFGFLVAYWLLDLFEVTVTVFGASGACRGDRSGPVELFRRIKREWKGPVATQVCVTVLRMGYWGLLGLFTDALVPLAAGPTALLLMALGTLLFLLSNLMYYYFDVVWESSLGAAAVDSCGGFRALGMAGELTEGPRRLRGAIMLLLYAGFSEVASLLFDLVWGLAMAEVVRVVLIVGCRGMLEVMNMYKLTAFTVFYYKCRGSRWEEGGRYARLPASPPR